MREGGTWREAGGGRKWREVGTARGALRTRTSSARVRTAPRSPALEGGVSTSPRPETLAHSAVGGVQWGCASVLSCVSVSRRAQPRQSGRASGPQPADTEASPRAAASPGLVQGRWHLLRTRSVPVPCALLTGEMCFP